MRRPPCTALLFLGLLAAGAPGCNPFKDRYEWQSPTPGYSIPCDASFVFPPDAGPVQPLTCGPDCLQLVLNKLHMPDGMTQDKYAIDYKCSKYNTLGAIVALLPQLSVDLQPQQLTDALVCSGQALNLGVLQVAKNRADGPARWQSQVAQDRACCSSTDLSQCCAEAASGCFSGSGSFQISSASPWTRVLDGTLAAGKLKLGPGPLVIRLGFFSTIPMNLDLVGATITGELTPQGLKDGILNGGIPGPQVSAVLLPSLAASLDFTYKNPKTDSKTVSFMKTLFDKNKDGTISTEEIRNSTMLQSALSGDADLDGDGVKEVTMGLGFEAVAAKIQ